MTILSSAFVLLVAAATSAVRGQSSATLTEPSVSIPTGTPALDTSTSVAAVSVGSTASAVPSQVALPPHQAWCPSSIFCAGSVLQTLNVAQLFADPKTIVDKPTSKGSQDVLADFAKLNPGSVTEGQVLNFLDSDFRGEGLELEALALSNFNPSPPFLDNVTDPLMHAFAQTVHGFWTQLIRTTNATELCGVGNSSNCESTLIHLNHTFVIPGGRFREQYYWDSYWIVLGLLESQLFDIANATLQNFMDELDTFGFIPNGGRIYYLNRSQPPLFINMLTQYVAASNDTSILNHALPLAEKELAWWGTNRTINVTSPTSQKTYAMAQYSVTNTAPRPESYFEDYTTANDPTQPALNETQRSDLYAELASGAETGWDYSSRWMKDPAVGLRTLNVKGVVPVCLNSILYAARTNLASLYSQAGQASNGAKHIAAAAQIKSGILDLLWDTDKMAFYDFNLTSNARNDIFSAATFYPLWSGIIPPEVLNGTKSAFGMFASVNMVMNRYNGTVPVTHIVTGQQWDAPNAWPPHQYIVLEALRNIPANISNGTIPSTPSGQSTFALIPSNQLGISEGDLIAQPLGGGKNATTTGPGADISSLNGTVVNGGNATSGETWNQQLQREVANRYMSSVLCSWHATGGSIPGVLPRLSNQELNVTQSAFNIGNMFEKFSNLDVNSAGQGGEYTVQVGFGWTNGAFLWTAANYGKLLNSPQCPDLLQEASTSSSSSSPSATSSSGKKSGAVSESPGGATGVIAWGVALVLCGLSGAMIL